MNDFKTCGCKPIESSMDSYDSSGHLFSSSFAKPRGLTIDCTDVTFGLKELDINLNTKALTTYLDAIDAITINGIKFVKLESEGKSEGIGE